MSKISEIFIANATSGCLVRKRYLFDLPKDVTETFIQRLLETKDPNISPEMVKDGIKYFSVLRNNLYFVAVTKDDATPLFAFELLTRFYGICKDFCGIVNEEAITTNQVLIYETLEEFIINGIVQLAVTEKLKPYVLSEPVPVRLPDPSPDPLSPNLFGIEQKTIPSTAADKPVVRRSDNETRKNEIFIDVVERITVLISQNGTVKRSEINGEITMKSFLVGAPDILMGLNEDLTIGKEEHEKGYGNTVHLDNLNYHPCVNASQMQTKKLLTVRPPEGQVSLLIYQVQGDFTKGLPFKLLTHVNDSDSRDVEVSLKLRCDVAHSTHAVNIAVCLPVPSVVTGLSQQLSAPGHSAEFLPKEKKVKWLIKKMQGKTEATAFFKLIVPNGAQVNKMELGPAILDFEISGFVSSNLQIRFIRVYEKEHSYVPKRWVRYITVPDSYVIKLN